MTKTHMTLLIALLATALSGCSGDDPVSLDPIVVPYQWPDTADKLMENFERAYSTMNIEEYGIVLHEDFKFIFIDYAEVWYKAQDMASTTNMFSGSPGENPDGTYRDPVQSITVNTLIRQTEWEAVPGNDPDFPNTEKALYSVQIVFLLEGGENTITIDCDQLFFVTSEEEDDDGTPRTRYYLAGQQDLLGGGKFNEDATWSAVKMLFRTDEKTWTRVWMS